MWKTEGKAGENDTNIGKVRKAKYTDIISRVCTLYGDLFPLRGS